MPRLRRLTWLPWPPWVDVEELRWLALPRKAGSLASASCRLSGVVAWICSVLTTVTGVGALAPLLERSVPVTVTASTWSAVAAAAACWARAPDVSANRLAVQSNVAVNVAYLFKAAPHTFNAQDRAYHWSQA